MVSPLPISYDGPTSAPHPSNNSSAFGLPPVPPLGSMRDPLATTRYNYSYPSVLDDNMIDSLSSSPPHSRHYDPDGISSLNSASDAPWSVKGPTVASAPRNKGVGSNPVGVIGSGKSVKKSGGTSGLWDRIPEPPLQLGLTGVNTAPLPPPPPNTLPHQAFPFPSFGASSLFSTPLVSAPATSGSVSSSSLPVSFFSSSSPFVGSPQGPSSSSYQLFDSPVPSVSSLKELHSFGDLHK